MTLTTTATYFASLGFDCDAVVVNAVAVEMAIHLLRRLANLADICRFHDSDVFLERHPCEGRVLVLRMPVDLSFV